jgi:hypothetical protein
MAMNNAHETNSKALSAETLSPEALAAFGAPSLVYVKTVAMNGVEAFAVHAADGSPIGLLPSRDEAFAAALQNDLRPMSVH